jgi:hypothetical protein
LRASYRDTSKPIALADPEVGQEYALLVDKVRQSLRELGREVA